MSVLSALKQREMQFSLSVQWDSSCPGIFCSRESPRMPEEGFNLKQTAPCDGRRERGRAQAAPDPAGQNSFAAGHFFLHVFMELGVRSGSAATNLSTSERVFPKIPQGMSFGDIWVGSSLPYSSPLYFTFILLIYSFIYPFTAMAKWSKYNSEEKTKKIHI